MAAQAPLADGKYYIYSSDAGKQPGENACVLPEDTLGNTLVSSFDTKSITLSNAPQAGQDSPLDPSDPWVIWLSNLDLTSNYSLLLSPDDTGDNTLQSFTFHLTDPWDLTFSSTADVLQQTFGDAASALKPPGVLITDDQPLLCCGLVAPEAVVKTTVLDVGLYAEVAEIVDTLPSWFGSLSVSLDPSTLQGQRNAVWFDPTSSSRTTVRLQFTFDEFQNLETLLQSALPELTVTNAVMVCKKVLAAGATADGIVAVDQGDVTLEVNWIITTKNNDTLSGTAGIEFKGSGMLLTLVLDDSNALTVILEWIGDLISADLSSVTDMFGPNEGIFDALNIRQITLDLDPSADLESVSLNSFKIDIEVAGSFGETNENQPVFLASYSWIREAGLFSTVQANLWTTYDTSPDRSLQPYYEPWSDLQPLTPNPANTINLETLIPGQTINIPDNIPSEVTSASLVLSQTGFSFLATVTAVTGSSTAPQPFLGECSLVISYQWGASSEFEFDIDIQAGITPSTSSTHTDPVLLEGALTYDRKS